MNLKKLVTLLSMAFAAIALAAPASASAEPVFTHEGEPIEHEDSKNVVFSGPFALAIPGTNPSQGIHCSHVTAAITLEATGTGKVTSFTSTVEHGPGEIRTTYCTSTPDNFAVHADPTRLPWAIHTDGFGTIKITGVEILYRVTHPSTPHLVVALRELAGDFHATAPPSQTENIEELNLSGVGSLYLFPGSVSATVSGNLERTTDTAVGSDWEW